MVLAVEPALYAVVVATLPEYARTRPHRKVSSWNHAKGARNMNAGNRVAFPGALQAVDPPVPGCFAARETDFPALERARSSGATGPGRLNVLPEITSPNARTAPCRISRSFRPDRSRSAAEAPAYPGMSPARGMVSPKRSF